MRNTSPQSKAGWPESQAPRRRDLPFFIVGSSRSGTSLLRDFLRSHSRLYLHAESHFIPWLHEAHGDPASRLEAEQLGRRILEVLRMRGFETRLEPHDFGSCRSFAHAAALPFRDAAQAAGKPRWGDKTPLYVEHIDRIRSIFPGALFIHVVRDARDVVRSQIRTVFGANTVFTAAEMWRRRVSCGRAARARHGPTVVHEVKFEELVTAPEQTLRSVLGFLDEPFEPAVLTRSPIRRRLSRSARAEVRNLCLTADATRDRAWRTGMSRRDQAIVESVAGDLLEELGYEIHELARPLRAHEVARWRLQDAALRVLWRLRDPRHRGQLGPELGMRIRASIRRR